MNPRRSHLIAATAAGALLLSLLPTTANAQSARTAEAVGPRPLAPASRVPIAVTEHDRAGRVIGGPAADRLRSTSPKPVHRQPAKAGTVTLTLRYLDRNGRLTADADASYVNLAGGARGDAENHDGESTLELPKGRYLLGAQVQTGQQTSALIQPLLTLAGDTTVTFDARLAKPMNIKVADPSVQPCLATLYVARRLDDGTFSNESFASGPLTGLSTGQLGPDVPAGDLTSSVVSQWAVPGKAGDFADSPVSYSTFNVLHGQFFTGIERLVQPSRMGRLVSHLHSTSPGLTGLRTVTIFAPDLMGSDARVLMYHRPRTVVEYVEAGAELVGRYDEAQLDPEGNFELVTVAGWYQGRTFEAGRTYDLVWNKAVKGPALKVAWGDRTGDVIRAGIPMFTDQAESWAYGMQDPPARTRLYQNGKLVAETDVAGEMREATVTPGRGVLRLESHVDRSPLTNRSTSVDAAWTFPSDTTPGEEQLPLWVVRFHPAVDLTNTMKTTGVSRIPLTVESLPGAKVSRVAKPSVEISGDGGKTWRRASVIPDGGGKFVAQFAVPAGARTVSLRAHAGDSLGNTVDQTILDAYGLR